MFVGWEAWIIGYREEYFHKIGLAPSVKMSLMNGSLDCELREYIIFAGNKRDFRASGGKLKDEPRPQFNKTDRKVNGSRKGGKPGDRKSAPRRPSDRKPFEKKPFEKKPFDRRICSTLPTAEYYVYWQA